MNPDKYGKVITLDWDGITPYEARLRTAVIYRFGIVRKIVLLQSPTKGFHVYVVFYIDINICRYRRLFKDDGNRLVHDILNRPDHIHDILWTTKTIDTIEWYGIKLMELEKHDD